jgi:hypothetical protein
MGKNVLLVFLLSQQDIFLWNRLDFGISPDQRLYQGSTFTKQQILSIILPK